MSDVVRLGEHVEREVLLGVYSRVGDLDSRIWVRREPDCSLVEVAAAALDIDGSVHLIAGRAYSAADIDYEEFALPREACRWLAATLGEVDTMNARPEEL
jgi:hypothetical protein